MAPLDKRKPASASVSRVGKPYGNYSSPSHFDYPAPFTNNFMTLIQDGPLLVGIGVPELQNMTSAFANSMTNPQQKLFVYILGAMFYFALSFPCHGSAASLSGGGSDQLFHNQNRYEYDILGIAVKKCKQPYSTYPS
ncbi:MAG TPA: hypothetical protein IGQ16_08205 [Thermosynechococcus sp. M3746_W2019_013]|uniref:hypothetical protein n=1 Tax=Thermosynechococcus sp. M3746_W2019_013 TaxID=2747806 RepID=UPI0019F83031|nr:hypothetical protein [Thermosynechococcus sp. M3746_W2019_013]HIK23628.1 hypothetical protein [Thermosynechococcus sp. M3746_W2019_013]